MIWDRDAIADSHTIMGRATFDFKINNPNDVIDWEWYWAFEFQQPIQPNPNINLPKEYFIIYVERCPR